MSGNDHHYYMEHLDLREYLRMREVGCLEQWADENDIEI